MRKDNIVLVGFMGAGKSIVSRKLAQILKMKLVSTDDFIEAKEARTIAEIFHDSGEVSFRELEEETIEKLALAKELVIDCGGGVVTNQNNLDGLKRKGTIFYLKASPEVIYERIKTQTHRPLLNLPDPLVKIKELLKSREAFYTQADYVIDTDNQSPDNVGQEILKLLDKSK